MNDRINIGKANVKDGISLCRAVAVGYCVNAGKDLDTSAKSSISVIGSVAPRGVISAVLYADMGKHHAAHRLYSCSVRCAGPCSDNYFLCAAGFSHHFAKEQQRVVICEDADNLTVFKSGIN